MKQNFAAFRLGDVRGIYPRDIDESFAGQFAHAFIHHFQLSGTVATGRDMRESGVELQAALIDGMRDSGVDVIDLGVCTTELGYFASTLPHIDAVIIVTASHNPANYNGFKCVLKNGEAVSYDTGLGSVKQLMMDGHRNHAARGALRSEDLRPAYVAYLKQIFPDLTGATQCMALNGLNGTAATLADVVAEAFHLPIAWFRQEPGPIPEQGADPVDPLLSEEMRGYMVGQDFSAGVAWDGDCDRCVFFDSMGQVIPAYYMVGLFTRSFLQRHQGGAIVFDTKLCWNTLDIIRAYKGTAVPSETGHAFMKKHMRQNKAVYGGELSSHHYFGDFFSCDSGMFAWLQMLSIVAAERRTLDELVADHRSNVCSTPELSLKLSDSKKAFKHLLELYEPVAEKVEFFDGYAFELPGDWRFSIRLSKTEPVVRLNLEARGNPDTLLNEGGNLLRQLELFKSEDKDWLERLLIQ